jgi:hypothetical protein
MIDAQGLPLTRISGGVVNSAKSGSPKPTRAPISISLEIASSISFSDGAATPGGVEKTARGYVPHEHQVTVGFGDEIRDPVHCGWICFDAQRFR